MIHARTRTYTFQPLVGGRNNDATVTMRIVSEKEYEEYIQGIKGSIEDLSHAFSFAFVSCEGIVDSDGAPLRTAEAILNAPGLVNLCRECVNSFLAENGLSENKKKDL